MMKATVLFGLVCCCVIVSVLSAPATDDSPQPAVMECVCVGASSCDIPQDKTQADSIQKETATRCAKSEVCCPKNHAKVEDTVQLIPEIFKF